MLPEYGGRPLAHIIKPTMTPSKAVALSYAGFFIGMIVMIELNRVYIALTNALGDQ